MSNGSSKKGKIVCFIVVFVILAVLFLAGFGLMSEHNEIKEKCSAEVTGTVVYEGTGSVGSPDSAANKYVSGKYWRQIKVEDDGVFRFSNVYADRGSEKKGDEITIHYDPDDPDDYYIGDNPGYYKATAIVLFVSGSLLALLMIFIMTKTNKYNKKQEEKISKYIYFDSPYGRFIFDAGDLGYECEVEWNGNVRGEKICALYFDTDIAPTEPRVDYYGMIGEDNTDRDINSLAMEIPMMREVLPGKCYGRLEKYLSDKDRTDFEIRKAVADYFLSKPELIKEGSSEQGLMDGIELSHIAAYRNGDTEFSIYFAADIYADDLHVAIKPDGTKEIRYKTYDSEECCDVL